MVSPLSIVFSILPNFRTLGCLAPDTLSSIHLSIMSPLQLAVFSYLVPLVFNGLFLTAHSDVTVIHRILFFSFKSKNLYAINKASNIKFS